MVVRGSPKLKLIENRIFGGEIAPGHHIAQFYADDAALLDALTTFAAGGLTDGESIIVIATPEHLRALRERLICARIDLASSIIEDRYITLNAETALSAFMIGGWPDEKLFRNFVSHLLDRVAANDCRVRAFGEIVSLLWAKGCAAATLRLEQLWNQFCQKSRLSLFCAYPIAGFPKDASGSLAEICAAHSRVIGLPEAGAAGSAESLARSQSAA
jgi:hypothetical protein